jgi:hypothetical protein
MKASAGNQNASHPAAEAPPPRPELPSPAAAPGLRKPYRLPELKRLGRLRSVTGSDLKW